MQKLLMGLLVAGVAMAGSAFTNAKEVGKKVSTVYVYAEHGTAPNRTYDYDQDGSASCPSSLLKPCRLDAGTYVFPTSGEGTITEADLNNSSKITISTTRSSY